MSTLTRWFYLDRDEIPLRSGVYQGDDGMYGYDHWIKRWTIRFPPGLSEHAAEALRDGFASSNGPPRWRGVTFDLDQTKPTFITVNVAMLQMLHLLLYEACGWHNSRGIQPHQHHRWQVHNERLKSALAAIATALA